MLGWFKRRRELIAENARLRSEVDDLKIDVEFWKADSDAHLDGKLRQIIKARRAAEDRDFHKDQAERCRADRDDALKLLGEAQKQIEELRGAATSQYQKYGDGW